MTQLLSPLGSPPRERVAPLLGADAAEEAVPALLHQPRRAAHGRARAAADLARAARQRRVRCEKALGEQVEDFTCRCCGGGGG